MVKTCCNIICPPLGGNKLKESWWEATKWRVEVPGIRTQTGLLKVLYMPDAILPLSKQLVCVDFF